jgi:hypothetical protein
MLSFPCVRTALGNGDAVTIRYDTDFERHRIQTLRIDKRAE